MAQNFPTFLELKEYIIEHPRATICELRDKFNQQGDDVISIKKKNTNQKQVLAYAINGDFFEYLQSFMKEEYVDINTDNMACLISDSTIYEGPEQLLPIVLSIK